MPQINYNDIKIKEVIIAEHTEKQKPLNEEPQPDLTYYVVNAWLQYVDGDGNVVYEERETYQRDELPPAFEAVLRNVLTSTRDRVREVRGII